MKDSDLHSRVLLVEGTDDMHVVIQLSKREKLPHNFYIIETGGIDKLLDAIMVEADVADRRVMGIVLDADERPNSRWQAVTDRLNELRREEHFDLPELPEQPKSTGTIVNGTLRIGIWLMPDNHSSGELEDFVAEMIPSTDPLWPLSEQYIDEIPSNHRRFRSKKSLRAKVHAWLATREQPRPMGQAIGAEDLDISVTNIITFIDWLRELFKEEL
ncbi:MAG: hypothetical protein OXK78_19180 [Caldilineaceae bacterium]|nr:hypothetical protein [Caldilineaceae bacterium]